MIPVRLMARAFALAVALLFLNSVNGSAQDADRATVAPPHLDFVDGVATLEREGQTQAAVPGMPFVPGDRLLTTRGRIEVLFPDGTALAVDEFTTVELQDRALLRMSAGRMLLTVAGVNDPANAVRYQIDTPSASATTDGPGEYRVAIMNGRDQPETELAVFRGYATLATDVGSTEVRAGERTLARDLLAPSQPLPFNSARFDAFDRWASVRRDARLGTSSTRYLPRDLYAYSSTFDRYGAWDYQGQYGYVWYPAVPVGWQPYYYGYWSPVPRYGWTWIGYDAWGWPTHHYGRWGFAGGRWFWVPGRTWGAAWVSWASAPGYVGWCPAGYCGGTAFSFGVSSGYPYNGWVVVSRPYFGHHYPVHRHALAPTAIPPRTPFVVQARAPLASPAAVQRPRAVPRPSGPPVGPGTRAAAGRQQPMTVPGAAAAVTPNQPEISGAPAGTVGRRVAVPRAQAAPSTSAPRYVPETRTLGGRSAATERRAPPAARPPADGNAAVTPRWYPPVTMTRPRAEQPTVPQTPAPGYRMGAVPRAQPPADQTANPAASPWRAQPRRPDAAPPSAFQPPVMTRPQAPTRSLGAPPPSAVGTPAPGPQPPRGPAAVPRAAPQAAPAQPPDGSAGPPAGARRPRSR